MLRSELHILQEMVSEISGEYQQVAGAVDPGRRTGWLDVTKTECARLKEKWLHQLFGPAKEHVFTRYVQFHQSGIILLSDKVYRLMPVHVIAPAQEMTIAFLEQVIAWFEELVEFLSHAFYKYFDPDHEVSIFTRSGLRAETMDLGYEFSRVIAATIDRSLIQAISNSFADLSAELEQNGLSYRQAGQVRDHAAAIRQLLGSQHRISTAEMSFALIAKNFNSVPFYLWCQHHLLSLLQPADQNSRRNETIDLETRKLQSIPARPDRSFNPDLPPLASMLSDWLKRQRNGDSAVISAPTAGEQLPLNFSVNQFALFIRVFYQEGCFAEKNVSRITRFFTRYFHTKKQAHISYKSFARAFYSADQSAAAVVRDNLQRMLNYVNKTYFP